MAQWETYLEPGKPDLLMQYEAVKDSPTIPKSVPSDEVCLIGIRKLYHERNNVFTDKLHQLTMQWQEWKTAQAKALLLAEENRAAELKMKSPSEWNGEGVCPMCKRPPEPEFEQADEELFMKIEEMGNAQ